MCPEISFMSVAKGGFFNCAKLVLDGRRCEASSEAGGNRSGPARAAGPPPASPAAPASVAARIEKVK